jgi:hypothetical protein
LGQGDAPSEQNSRTEVVRSTTTFCARHCRPNSALGNILFPRIADFRGTAHNNYPGGLFVEIASHIFALCCEISAAVKGNIYHIAKELQASYLESRRWTTLVRG